MHSREPVLMEYIQFCHELHVWFSVALQRNDTKINPGAKPVPPPLTLSFHLVTFPRRRESSIVRRGQRSRPRQSMLARETRNMIVACPRVDMDQREACSSEEPVTRAAMPAARKLAAALAFGETVTKT